MSEIELKLQVSRAALPALERALAAPSKTSPSVRTRLQAIYFDTPGRRLALAGVAVRLRKEGRRWVQTAKAGPAHGMERAEHNVVVPVAAGLQPALDLSRHDGTPVGEALAAALKAESDSPPRLVAVYTTDIWRRHRHQRSRYGVVELALDQGEIRAAAPDGAERRWPVCELEVELVSGSPRAVIDGARRLAAKHGLWLDVRTKAERGERLARGLASVAATKAQPLKLRKSMTPHEAWAAVLRNVIAQALPNWSEVASPSGTSEVQPEHVHQLRVALRRLRSAERFFAGWPGIGAPVWADGVAELFTQLGVARDRDVLAGGLQREIDAALTADGQPPLHLPHADEVAQDPTSLHAPGLALIDVLADAVIVDAPAEAPTLPPEPGAAAAAELALTEHIATRLADWHAQVKRDARRFDELDDEARHRLRKRLKRLRYAIEFSESLFASRAVERYLAPLRAAQERLGEFNDVCVAQAAYRRQVEAEPRAWFALGWLSRRRTEVLEDCARDLKTLRKAEPFWGR
jgi:inorganic triphosphatase YgiF